MAKKKEKTLEEKLQEALVPENQWPYILPENWCWVKLNKLYNVNPKNILEDDSVDAAFIPMANIEPNFIGKYKFEVDSWNKIRKGHTQFADGDVTFAKISPCFENGKAFIAENLPNGIGAGTTELIVLRNRKIVPKYTFYLISTEKFVNGGRRTYSGVVGQQRISIDYVNQFPIPLSPLPEQKRIVHRIESLFAKLDEAKEKIQQVLDGAEMRKASILHKAFTGELTKTWRKENGISEDSWEVKKLSDCGNWYGGGTPSKTHPEYWEKGNILWITSKDMKSDYIEDSQQHINSYGVENSSAKYIEEHALICVMRSGILRHSFPVAVIKKPFTVNQDLKVLVPNKMINIEYLLFICKYKEQSILNSCMKNGTTVESINFDKLKNFSIMIPAEIEQIRIVNIIKKFLCRENDVLNKCNKFITSIATMKKSILAKAFRGELGTNNPTEDSALNLLKEVLQDKS